MLTSLLALRFIAEHSFPAFIAEALKGQFAASIDTARKADALGTIGSGPAYVASAHVGFGAITVI